MPGGIHFISISLRTQVIDFNQANQAPKGSVLSLGGFDGIHLGHQALIKRLLFEAKKKKIPSCLCLFDPLPFQVLKGQSSFKRLFSIEETKELLQPFHLDFFCIIPFNYQFSKLKPGEFVRSFLIRQFDPVQIIVGYDFSFAYQKEGDFSVLKDLADQFGFSVEKVEAYLHKGKPVSSSRIRKCLSLAQMKELKALLGRPFSIQGTVVRGEARGRQLGFPTANLQVKHKELPSFGVYGGRAKAADLWHKAVINIGRRPTFDPEDKRCLIEVHIISSEWNLYDQHLKVELDFFIRKEKAFSKISELKMAIKQDVKVALAGLT